MKCLLRKKLIHKLVIPFSVTEDKDFTNSEVKPPGNIACANFSANVQVLLEESISEAMNWVQ